MNEGASPSDSSPSFLEERRKKEESDVKGKQVAESAICVTLSMIKLVERVVLRISSEDEELGERLR